MAGMLRRAAGGVNRRPLNVYAPQHRQPRQALGLAPRPSDRRDPDPRSTVTNSANRGPPRANAHLGLLPPPQLRDADTLGMSISSRPVRLYREEAERLVPLATWGTTEKGQSGILMGAGSKLRKGDGDGGP
jgi:hypothetical protein